MMSVVVAAILLAVFRFESGKPGYRDAKHLTGVFVEALGCDGGQLIFVGVRAAKSRTTTILIMNSSSGSTRRVFNRGFSHSNGSTMT
jgi:hypothetical protein